MGVLTQLSQEHKDLRVHMENIWCAVEARDAVALAESMEGARTLLTDELDAHIIMEEAEVFAVVSDTLGEGLVAAFYEEHVEIRSLRDEVFEHLARGEAPYEQCLRLAELILAHQEREDLMLFPSAQEAVPALAPNGF